MSDRLEGKAQLFHSCWAGIFLPVVRPALTPLKFPIPQKLSLKFLAPTELNRRFLAISPPSEAALPWRLLLLK